PRDLRTSLMRCPHCQHENLGSVKFCGECGARLDSLCPSCGAANPPENKFCGQCGAALVQAAPSSKFTSPESYTPKHLAEKILTAKIRSKASASRSRCCSPT